MLKPKKKSWIVRLRCVVIKEVITPPCTEAEAACSPWDHCEEETEIDQVDWEVQGDPKENK